MTRDATRVHLAPFFFILLRRSGCSNGGASSWKGAIASNRQRSADHACSPRLSFPVGADFVGSSHDGRNMRGRNTTGGTWKR